MWNNKISTNNMLRAAFLFGFASFSAWVPVFTLWLEDQEMKGSQIGFIAAIPWAVMLILQPLWGILADKYGKAFCLRIALVGSALGFLLFHIFSNNHITIIILTFLVSVFYTPVLSLLDSIALDNAENSGGVSYSEMRFWGAPGFALGAMITGWLIPEWGAEIAFYTAAFFLLMVLLSICRYPIVNSLQKNMDIEFKGLNRVMTNKLLMGFLFVVIIVSVGQSAISYYLPIYMRQIGATSDTTGIALAIQALSELPFYFIAAWLIKRINSGTVVFIAIFATALRLFFYSVNYNPQIVMFIETMNGITWTLLWIASVEFVNEMVPPQWRTTGQSLLWAAYYGAGAILGNIIIGRMYESLEIHYIYSILSLSILIIAITALPLFIFQKTKFKKSRS